MNREPATAPMDAPGSDRPRDWRPRTSPWLIALTVMIPTFMEILDTTIVAVALPHMAGNLSASTDEATWVMTSYLVTNAIVLPASGWLALYFGRRRLLIACVAIFTVSSFLCGSATSLGMLIAARVLQGAGGGALQPLSQAILLESFPPAKRGAAMAAFGMGALWAPIIGPTLGGWIVDRYSWPWIFYLNLPLGILAILLAHAYVEDPPYIRNAKPGRIDSIGFGLMAIWLGTLQIVLDKGQQDDWFAAVWIRWVTGLSGVAMAAFILWELRSKEPIVNLRVLANRNFAVGITLVGMLGVAIYTTVTLLPLFLQTLMGYPALESGMAVSPRGMGVLLILPIVGRVTGLVDNRYLIATGFVLVGLTNLMIGRLNLDIAMENVVWPNILQGVGIGLIFVPLTTLTMATLRNEQIGNATGIFNLMRNLGGSFAISAVSTFLARDAQVHQTWLVSHLTPYDPALQERLEAIQEALRTQTGDVQAQQQAYGVLYGILQRQATLLAFVDNFRWLALLCLLCAPAVWLFKKVKPKGPVAAH